MCRECISKTMGFKLDLIETPAAKRTPFVTVADHKQCMRKAVGQRVVPEGKVYWVCERQKDKFGGKLGGADSSDDEEEEEEEEGDEEEEREEASEGDATAAAVALGD